MRSFAVAGHNKPKKMSKKSNRVRKNITLPPGLYLAVKKIQDDHGYGFSELITGLMGRLVAEEAAIHAEGVDRFPSCLLPMIPTKTAVRKKAPRREAWFRELRAMGL